MIDFLAGCNVFGAGTEANKTFLQILGTAILVVRVLQIVIPIALIIWGTIDLGKAVIAGEDKKIQEGRQIFIKRLIAAVIVFLVPFVVNLVMSFVSKGEWKQCYDDARDSKETIKDNSSIKNYNY